MENNDNSNNVSINVEHIDTNLLYDVMKVPSCSDNEYRMLTYLIMWATSHGISYELDDYNNLYLTKGELEENEFYPCATAHIDTVQSHHLAYIEAGAELDILTREVDGHHEIYCDGFGLGGDDKVGVFMALNMLLTHDKMKASFFRNEEIGCVGSDHMNKDWFKDVGYAIGYDSPGLNRAAWACSGIMLFNKDFYLTHMKEICDKWGMTKFYSEPCTDVQNIRRFAEVICMNFGSGYYNCHSNTEFCVIEEIDHAFGMGLELVEHLGLNQYKLKYEAANYTYKDEDRKFLRSLGESSTKQSKPASKEKDAYELFPEDVWDYENENDDDEESDAYTLQKAYYMLLQYQEYVGLIEEKVKSVCDDNGIDFDSNFKDLFENKIEI